MKSFTITEIRKYIESQDSLGDVLYNLSEAAIENANCKIDTTHPAYIEGFEEYSPDVSFYNPYVKKDVIEHIHYEAGWQAAADETDSTW